MNREATLSPAGPIPSAQPSTVHKIFVGRGSLRAGWSLLVFIGLLAAFLATARFVNHQIHPHHPNAANITSEMAITSALIDEDNPVGRGPPRYLDYVED